jgi:hypothetical protein
MIGEDEIRKLSLELNIDSKEITEVLRHHIAEYYKVDWIRFTDDASIILIKFNNKKRTIDEKKIFVKKEFFKKIVENTIDSLYAYIEKINLLNLRKKLNLQKIEGIYKSETDSVLFYKKGVLQKEIIGKISKKTLTKELENKFTMYRLQGNTLHKKGLIYVVNCVPINYKVKDSKDV